MILAGKEAEGRAYLVKGILPPQGVYLSAIENFVQSQVRGLEEFADDASRQAHDASVLMFVTAAFATALAVVIGILLTRSITRPIDEAVKVAQTVASGDLSSR